MNISSELVLIQLGMVAVVTLLITFSFGGYIIDLVKRRMRFLVFITILPPVGMFILLFPTIISKAIGISITIFSLGLSLIDVLTIVTHETTILNRGRLYSYLLLLSFIPAQFLLLLLQGNLLLGIVINIIFVISVYEISQKYTYIETEERLSMADKNFFENLSTHSIIGYLIAFLTLGFVVGNAFPSSIDNILSEPLSFFSILLFFIGITGILLDNMGRKWTLSGSVLTISTVIIFSSILKEIYAGIFITIAIPIMFLIVFTFVGDFSTQRDTLKFRGRISAIFLFFGIVGYLFGLFIHTFLTNLFVINPEIWWWALSFDTGINSFLLIILLVWIMPLPEVFSSKEADWAEALRTLYVFNKNSVCLHSKRFSMKERNDNISADIITGGLSGIMGLISEITNEKKNLRIIDKGNVFIYFSYGTDIIVALTAEKYLPILFKKSELFIKRFEKVYHNELSGFVGETSVFSDGANAIIERYFS
ncbi:MAG: hypothetical protein EU541_07250 [Promethearchaeota archaeon]|nr:MAG: hypothetical protein EU541_07250 [Candidatus Lokiarchaeota archaeon]